MIICPLVKIRMGYPRADSYKTNFAVKAGRFVLYGFFFPKGIYILFGNNLWLDILIWPFSGTLKFRCSKFLFQKLSRRFFIKIFLFLQTIIPPLSCVTFKTNRTGKFSKSISSKEFHTPYVGIICSLPILSATNFFASYLSTICV